MVMDNARDEQIVSDLYVAINVPVVFFNCNILKYINKLFFLKEAASVAVLGRENSGCICVVLTRSLTVLDKKYPAWGLMQLSMFIFVQRYCHRGASPKLNFTYI